MASYSVLTTFRALDQMSGPINNINRSTSRLVKTTKSALSPVTGLVGQLSALGLAAVGFSSQIQLDKNLKSLSAITGVTGSAFDDFKVKISETSTEMKMFKGDVAKAFEIVGSAKPDLLASADGLNEVTKAAILLSRASGDELVISAANLTGVMNQFNLGAEQATRTINVLAAGSVVGAANITRVAESFVNFGAVASGANLSLEESVALVEVLASKSLFGAEAGTKLRGSVLQLQKAGVGYSSGAFNMLDAMTEVNTKMKTLGTESQKDAYILKIFGAENITAGKILLNNIDMYKQFTKGVTGTNTALDQAKINTSSLSTTIDEMINSFKNAVTTTDEANLTIRTFKDLMKLASDNMNTLINIAGISIGVFAAVKTYMFLASFGMEAYTIATSLAAIATNALAMPLWAVIGVVAALGSTLYVVYQHWGKIVDAFASGDIMGGLKAVGVMLLDLILWPLEKIMEIIALIPGMGGGAEWIGKIREDIGAKEKTTASQSLSDKPVVTPESASAIATAEYNKTTTTNKNSTVKIDWSGIPSNAKVMVDGKEMKRPANTLSI